MFDIKSYHRAGSIRQAIQLLTQDPKTRLIAGGTDVLIKLHKGKGGFHHLVDIHDVAELNFITLTGDEDLVIGPGTCFTAIAESALVRRHIDVLSTAVGTIGGPQVRNMATIGGNICNGVPSADSVPPLLALNAVLTLEGPAGVRKFHTGCVFLRVMNYGAVRQVLTELQNILRPAGIYPARSP